MPRYRIKYEEPVMHTTMFVCDVPSTLPPEYRTAEEYVEHNTDRWLVDHSPEPHAECEGDDVRIKGISARLTIERLEDARELPPLLLDSI